MYYYTINQFDVESNFHLPCDGRSSARSRPGAARRRLAIRHEHDSLHEFPHVYWLAQPPQTAVRAYDVGTGILVCIGDLLRLHVDGTGSAIQVDFDPSDEGTRGLAAACVVNLGIAICSILQGMLPLHAVGVDLDGSLVAISAGSGAGKSTLLWALIQQGGRFASDDLLPVRIEDGTALAFPSVSVHGKLSDEGLIDRGLEPGAYREMFPGAGKYWVPIDASDRAQEPGLLRALFILQPYPPSAGPNAVNSVRINGGAALVHLLGCLQSLSVVYGMAPARDVIEKSTRLLETVPLYMLNYPKRRDILPALCETVRNAAAYREHPSQPRPFGALRDRFTRAFAGRYDRARVAMGT